ncbi:MAG: hypothetical protein MUF10_18985 [Thermoanaerobaculaceae bacterium]|jgi:hypothetical protein|nr:hypothetical protein [Thermoanaerobaculaceae bacterium]
MRGRGLLGLVVALVGVAVAPVWAGPTVPDDYTLLQGWRASQQAMPVPAEGIAFGRDVAIWKLESGTVRPLEPLADGFVPGFVFEGQGRFVMEIPDAFEVQQLRRFAERPGLDRIDQPFKRLVLRTTSDLAGKLAPAPAGASYQPAPLLKDRNEEWLRYAGFDPDARLVAGHLTPGDDYLLVDVETADLGWVSFELEPWDQEEVHLIKLQHLNDWPETWVSLDRASERDGQGKPTSVRKAGIDLTFATIDVDVSKHQGSRFDPDDESLRDWTTYSATVAFLPQRDGARAVRLSLDPQARVTRVATVEGVELPFVRDHIGGRFAGLDNELYDRSLVVVFPEPMARMKMKQLVVDYTMKTFNFASGREWYPGEGDGWDDLHTARVRFRLPKKMQVRCVGELEEEKQEGNLTISTWSVTSPTRALGYSFGAFKEERIKLDGVPEVVSFGVPSSVVTGNMVRNVAIDVANSLRFYQWYFNTRLPFERLQATCISGYHGQAFEGLLHLSQLTFNSEHPGATELFRAHEVAHELWGHAVGWKSYRDQWLSEAFAEYSAMLFVETTMAKEGHFEEMLQVYTNEQTGSIRSAMSIFARPWSLMLTPDERRLVGPIAAGVRASTARVPAGYEMQCYDKGAMVLHMLRSLLSGMARDRDLFREVMQDFLATYTGKNASTADFQRTIEKHTGSSWQSFFDQWVYGTDIPTLTWSHKVGPGADGRTALTLNIKTTDAPQFAQPVPVQVVFKGDKVGTIFVPIDSADTTMSVPVPEVPKKVVLAPRSSVLARIREQ